MPRHIPKELPTKKLPRTARISLQSEGAFSFSTKSRMPFVAGFLFLLTLCKQPVSDCTEIICVVEGCHVVKRWGAILLTLGLSSGMGFTAQAGGWERLSNTSPWKGSFVRSDGRTITITDAAPDLLFISMVSSQELGMACFAPGIYRSFYVNENTENEKWEFSVYTSMSWEEWTLHGPSDKREVGRVDYTYMDLYDNPIYTKEDMILYNTMSGYVIEDVAGQVFAWVYPMGQTVDQSLMVQPYGSEKFHHIYLNNPNEHELPYIPEMYCYDILCNSPALESRFRMGLQVLYDQNTETISRETCYLFSLGTNREDQFVREKISRTVLYFRTMRLINVCIGIQTFIICPSV